MPFSYKEFKQRLKTTNKTFSRFKLSSLEPLLDALGGEYDPLRGNDWRTLTDRQIDEVQLCLFALPDDKYRKYRSALDFLAKELGLATRLNQEIAIPDTRYSAQRIFKVAGTVIGGRYERVGGWKIHVSAHPYNCVRTAQVILPLLYKRDEWHKYVTSPQALQGMQGGQRGKFITIYTRDEAHCADLVNRMEILLHPRQLTGPRIVTDEALGRSGLLSRRRVEDFRRPDADLDNDDDDDRF